MVQVATLYVTLFGLGPNTTKVCLVQVAHYYTTLPGPVTLYNCLVVQVATRYTSLRGVGSKLLHNFVWPMRATPTTQPSPDSNNLHKSDRSRKHTLHNSEWAM